MSAGRCFYITRATSQSPCLHENLATAEITSKIREAYFISFHLQKIQLSSVSPVFRKKDCTCRHFAKKCSDNTESVWTGQMQVDLRGSALRSGIQKKAMGIRVSEWEEVMELRPKNRETALFSAHKRKRQVFPENKRGKQKWKNKDWTHFAW